MTSSDPNEVVQACPVCGGAMVLVYERWALKVCVCKDCYAGIYIPYEAWDVARSKHQHPDPPESTSKQSDQSKPKDN